MEFAAVAELPVAHVNMSPRFEHIKITTRLCPLQVLGKQSTSTAFKARSALRMMSLEAEDINYARGRVCSLLSDMGTEAQLWLLPDITPAEGPNQGRNGRCFPSSMPLHDFDHLLHHVMLACEEGFAVQNILWSAFEQQISAIAKVFSKQDFSERYVQKAIWENGRVPRHVKKSLAAMFSSKCPTYVKTRWHYSFDVLHWVSQRQQLIEFLEAGSVSVSETRETDVTASEASAFGQLSRPEERLRFWAVFWTHYLLQEWGFSVQSWLHKCPCAEHGVHECKGPCPFNGRRLIELADGKCEEFLRALRQLVPESKAEAARALLALKEADPEAERMLQRCFMMGKRSAEARFLQSTAYYTEYPWSLPKLLRYILAPASERSAAIKASQTFAACLCTQFQNGGLETGTFGDKFFAGPLYEALREWGAGRVQHMNILLFKEVLSYATALVAMQRLESRHHLVGMKMAVSRANSAAATSAMLRRHLNDDIKQETFQAHFEEYLQQFSRLVPEEWNSMSELHRLVSGHHLQVMFADTAREDAMIQAAAIAPRPTSAGVLELLNHIKAVLSEGGYYAFPCAASTEVTRYELCQVVTFSPSGKKYMQRVVGWAHDRWYESIGVVRLGNVNVFGDKPELKPFPFDFTVDVGRGEFSALPVKAFFQFGFDHVFHFGQVQTAREFCAEAIETVAEEEAAAKWQIIGDADEETAAALAELSTTLSLSGNGNGGNKIMHPGLALCLYLPAGHFFNVGPSLRCNHLSLSLDSDFRGKRFANLENLLPVLVRR